MSAEIIAIVSVGVAIAGLMLVEVRGLRAEIGTLTEGSGGS